MFIGNATTYHAFLNCIALNLLQLLEWLMHLSTYYGKVDYGSQSNQVDNETYSSLLLLWFIMHLKL